MTTTNIYLAGKIAKNGWRHEIASRINLGQTDWAVDAMGGEIGREWDVIPNALGPFLDLTGPFFVGCDHGCAHGPGSHGITGGCILSDAQEEETVKLCLDAIDRSDVVFAWIDEPDAYGTLVELGYAKAKGKRVIVAFPPETWVRGEDTDLDIPEPRHDMWFLHTMADVTVAEVSASAAWKRVLDGNLLSARAL